MNISNPLVKVADRITALEAGVPAVDVNAIAAIVKGGLEKADVGLPDVANLAPDAMPVSTAQAAALSIKVTKIATLAAAAALSLSAFDVVMVDRYAANSQISNGPYGPVASEPSHALKFPDKDGNWFEYKGANITPELAGATGGSDNTAATQRAIDASIALGFRDLFLNRIFTVGSLTVTPPFSIRGRGRQQSGFFLKGGTNDDLLKVPYVASGVNLSRRDLELYNMQLHGNNGQNTTGHVINLLDGAPLTTADTRGYGVKGSGLTIKNAPQHGIYIGINRSEGSLSDCTIEYSGLSNGYLKSSGDWRFYGIDFGGSVAGHGFLFEGGFTSVFISCNFYSNALKGFHAPFGSGGFTLDDCGFDRNQQDGVSIICDTSKSARIIKGCRFTLNSASATNTYSDLSITNNQGVSVSNCVHRLGGATKPKYLYESLGTPVERLMPTGCTVFSDAYGTDITNDNDNVMLPEIYQRIKPGQTAAGFGSGGATSTTAAIIILQYAPKKKKPSNASLPISAASDFELRGGSGTHAVTAITGPQMGWDRGTLNVAATGLVAGQDYILRAKTADAFIDVIAV